MHSSQVDRQVNWAENANLVFDMENEIRIRPATLSDLAILVANNQALAMETENRRLEDAVIQNGVRKLLEDRSKGFYLVAEIGDEVVGNLMITSEWSDWRCGEMWWFQSVYVAADHRGKGVFRALYQHVFDMAKSEGAKELRLYVERDNLVAQKVYTAMGMQLSHYDMWEVVV